MRQIYNRSFTVTFHTGDSGYVFSEPIDPGYVLRVLSCFAYAPQRGASENVVIGIDDGGAGIVLQAKATLAQQKGASVDNEFILGEGDKVYAYLPDSDDGDTIGIHISGFLIPLKEWEKGME